MFGGHPIPAALERCFNKMPGDLLRGRDTVTIGHCCRAAQWLCDTPLFPGANLLSQCPPLRSGLTASPGGWEGGEWGLWAGRRC